MVTGDNSRPPAEDTSENSCLAQEIHDVNDSLPRVLFTYLDTLIFLYNLVLFGYGLLRSQVSNNG